MNAIDRFRGLAALVTDGVVHGTSAIERVHLEVARRPFDILEQIPGVAVPASAVRVVHRFSTRLTYASIRGITRVVGTAVDAAIDVATDRAPPA